MKTNFSFKGKYAGYVNFLSNDLPIEGLGDKFKIFNRYIDIYMNSAIFGLLYNKTEKFDSDLDSDANDSWPNADIRGEMFVKEQKKISNIYKLMILLSPKINLTDEERVEKAFRYTEDDEEMLKLLDSYVLGGLTHIHNAFKDVRTAEGAAKQMFDLINEFYLDNKD